MLKWIDVPDSVRVTAIAYDADAERIYVRLPNGVEWWYDSSPVESWREFADPKTAKYQYMQEVLSDRPNGQRK